VSKNEQYREATGDAKYHIKNLKAMTTLFNTSNYRLTAENKPRSTRHSGNKMSKNSHPLAQGSTMYPNAQRALQIAIAGITAFYSGHAEIISQKPFQDGTAEIVAQVWEDGENVLYQFDVTADGDYCEMKI